MSLKFSEANAKLQHLAAIYAFQNKEDKIGKVYSFDLPAGYTCPGAKHCKSRAVKTAVGWRIVDGPHCKFRCYSASQEVVLPSVRKLRTHNLAEITGPRSSQQIADMFHQDIPEDCTILRLHTSGDFFKQSYLDGVMLFAQESPNILIYSYTKAIPFWINRKGWYAGLPNFRLVASMGGKWDTQARRAGFRTCNVVMKPEGLLPIDHDDSYAAGLRPTKHFAVLIHGTQPAGSTEGKVVYALRQTQSNGYRKSGKGYGFKKRKNRND